MLRMLLSFSRHHVLSIYALACSNAKTPSTPTATSTYSMILGMILPVTKKVSAFGLDLWFSQYFYSHLSRHPFISWCWRHYWPYQKKRCHTRRLKPAHQVQVIGLSVYSNVIPVSWSACECLSWLRKSLVACNIYLGWYTRLWFASRHQELFPRRPPWRA